MSTAVESVAPMAVVSAPVVSAPELLVAGTAHPQCRACVTIPVRNEEETLADCLDGLAGQVDASGRRLRAESFEVLLLCNNCTDGSAAVARAWRETHPEMVLHVAERSFRKAEAHAGTARRLLMETAWCRLEGGRRAGTTAILCTDGDSVVERDWIWRNLLALEGGADAVGGAIELHPGALEALPEPARRGYEEDRRYAALVAELEDLIDPQEGDPWPRHLHHFGSSLACTPEAYRRAGGMPAAAVLEDEAFVNQLRRGNLRLRHEPTVRVYTSARLEGRATKGLAGQLRHWNELPSAEEHLVQSAEAVRHRFRMLRALREAFASDGRALGELRERWRRRVLRALELAGNVPELLQALDCDRMIAETFAGAEQEPIEEATKSLRAMVVEERRSAG